MSSLFTPVFFPPPSKSTSNIRARSSSHPPSSSSPPSDPIAAHTTLLSSIHLALSHLEPVLCPPSPPGSPKPESLKRISRIREQVLDAVDAADGERSSGKWGQVGRKLKLSCTRGRWGYQEVVAGARTRINTGSSRGTKVDKAINQWVLADTEDEWFEWERKRDEDRRRMENVAVDGNAEEVMVIDDDRGSLGVKERVKRWQQNVPVGVEPAPPSSLPMNTQGESWAVSGDVSIARKNSRQSDLTGGAIPIPSSSLSPSMRAQRPQQASAKMAAVKNKAKASTRDQKEPSLGFPVVKRSSMTLASGKKPYNDPTPVPSQHPKDACDGKSPTPPAKAVNSDIEIASSNPLGDMPPPPDVVTKIGDVSEMSFLPPSFPSGMETSTPNGKDTVREKPLPITSSSLPFPSSPGPVPPSTSFHSPNKLDAVNISSSLPPPSSPHQPVKRPRETTPPLQTSSGAFLASSPPLKKARTMPEYASSNLAIPVTPSTPPPAAKPIISSKGLGNAKGLPVPSTPDRHLPTLTELLASSRRSKPRPRPPSRAVKADYLPFTKELGDEGMRDRTPDPSPAKSMFSSPASGSTMSPASMIVSFRSPATPTFTQHPSAFAPDFMSSQVPLGVGSSLGQGSSAYLGMGYDSQFDVEGQVDRVSELLERDVDFDGWLRDIPAMEDGSS